MTAVTTPDLLLLAIRDPNVLLRLDDDAWPELIERARTSVVLARLSVLAQENEVLQALPPTVRNRLNTAAQFARYNQTLIRFEVNRLLRVFKALDGPILLLKGGAYLMGNLPPSRGRIMSDLDILVPKGEIGAVEQALIDAGWERAELADYDQHYYRDWMHEIPPMWHPERRVVVDIHHTIVPVTSRYRPYTEALFDASVDLASPGLKALCPADMVLHSAVHLFSEEFTVALRDLTDLHDLLEIFGKSDQFWATLVAHANLHGFGRILYYALHHTKTILGTEIPESVLRLVEGDAPNLPLRGLMNYLISKAIIPPIRGRGTKGHAIATWLLFLRSHWLKMPAYLLISHLTVKSSRRLQKSFSTAP